MWLNQNNLAYNHRARAALIRAVHKPSVFIVPVW